MFYLLDMFFIPFVIALVAGLWWGWRTSSMNTEGRFGGMLPVAVILFVLGLILAHQRLIPGRPGLWLDVTMLLFGAFFGACAIACLIRQFLDVRPMVPVWERVAAEAAKPAMLVAPTPPVAAPTPVAPPAQALTGAAAAADAMRRGRKPSGLPGPRGGKPDDLKLVRGIGPQNEGRLHALGVWHFDQIAAWTPEESLWVGGYLAFPGRIEREGWVAQAKVLATGAMTEFARRAARGEVPTSKDDGTSGQGNVASLPPREPKG